MPYLDITLTLPPQATAEIESLVGVASSQFDDICRKAVAAGTRAMRAAMVRLAAPELGLSPGDVRGRAWAGRGRANPLLGVATAGRHGWSLRSLGVEQDAYEVEGLGVTAELSGGKARRYPRGFILAGAAGRHSGRLTGAFEREPGSNRLPIRRLYVESVTAALVRAASEPRIRELGMAAAMRTLERERNKLLKGT